MLTGCRCTGNGSQSHAYIPLHTVVAAIPMMCYFGFSAGVVIMTLLKTARQSGRNSDAPCRFCESHARTEFPAHNLAPRCLDETTCLCTLCTDPAVSIAGDNLQSVAFVGAVCHAAAVCEM